MNERIVGDEPDPTSQQGQVVRWCCSVVAPPLRAIWPVLRWYDQIRMLDAEGYPHAFLEAHGIRLEFRRVCQRSDGLHADVRIIPVAATTSCSANGS
jgi:methionyl-tRNA formyltransferase